MNRGDFGKPGVNSLFRARTPAENLARFREMRAGEHEDGSMVLRAKIDMASPNINLRDPAIYRIRRATHHNTGDAWCIYPMYTFGHPIEDALEQITHNLTNILLELEVHVGRAFLPPRSSGTPRNPFLCVACAFYAAAALLNSVSAHRGVINDKVKDHHQADGAEAVERRRIVLGLQQLPKV